MTKDKYDYEKIREAVLGLTGYDLNNTTHLVVIDYDQIKGYKIKRPKSVILSKGGKGEAVRRHNPATANVEDVCRCWYNADFSRGCIAQVHGSNLLEVINNNGHYLPGNLKVYHEQGLSDQRCSYCYSYRNTGGVEPKVVNERTRESFLWFNPKVVRIGKLTEAGHPYYYTELVKFLELCAEKRTRVIFPNKMLSFGIDGASETNQVIYEISRDQNMMRGKNLAELLKRVGGSLMYSIGYDNEEPGAVSQGFTNRWRLLQGEMFFSAGVNVSYTVVCDVTRSIEDNVNSGSSVEEALKFSLRNGVNLRILPIRPFASNFSRLCFGSVNDLARGGVLTSSLPGIDVPVLDRVPYLKGGNNQYIAQFLHPDFRRLIEKGKAELNTGDVNFRCGVGVCGKVGGIEHCDACNIDEQRLFFPASELVQIDYSKKKKNKSYGKKKDKRQKKLF